MVHMPSQTIYAITHTSRHTFAFVSSLLISIFICTYLTTLFPSNISHTLQCIYTYLYLSIWHNTNSPCSYITSHKSTIHLHIHIYIHIHIIHNNYSYRHIYKLRYSHMYVHHIHHGHTHYQHTSYSYLQSVECACVVAIIPSSHNAHLYPISTSITQPTTS